MKWISHIIFSVIVLCSLVACQQENYTIKGDLHQVNVSKVYLTHLNTSNNTIEVLDSSEVHEGHFTFKGTVQYPIACCIRIGRRTTVNLIVENSNILVSGSAKIPEEIKVTGSQSDEDFHHLVQVGEDLLSKKNEIWANMVENKTSNSNKILSTEDTLLNSTKNFIEEHPLSVGASYFIYYLYIEHKVSIDQLEPLINAFDESLDKSEYIQYLKKEIVYSNKIRIGDYAPSFKIKSIKSDSIFAPSSFRGHYLYIDFSASWLNIYHRHVKKVKELENISNLYILTVYLDSDKDKLIKKSSEIPWFQVCDYKYWECEATKLYGVNKIPYGVLVGPEGNIIAIDPRISDINNLIVKK